MKNWHKTKWCMLLAASMLLSTWASAQGGEWSIGPRFGGSSGISLKKHNKRNTSAMEFLAQWNFDNDVKGFGTTVLFERLAPLGGGQKLAAIFGFGPGVVFGDEFRLGAAGIIGLDWRISKPINLQLDWQPTWYFTNGSDFSPLNAGFTIRYVFNQRKVN